MASASDSGIQIMDPSKIEARIPSAVTRLSGRSSAQAMLLMGDWQALSELDVSELLVQQTDPQIAACVAAARLQLGATAAAKDAALACLEAGCEDDTLSRLLTFGLHLTLARIGKLLGDEDTWSSQNASADLLLGIAADDPLVHARKVRELARIGLMPQALAAIEAESRSIDEIRDLQPRSAEARLQVLRSEMEILQHEHSLELQRRSRLVSAPQQPADPAISARIEALRSLSTSQLGQDLWIIEKLRLKRGGFFVEFGATDGVRLSNTFLLEFEFGWNGLCAEPNPTMFERLRKNRRCRTSPACIGARSGELVEFVLAEEYGGLVRHMGNDQHAPKRSAYYADPVTRIQLQTVSLNDFLIQNDAPHDIDYISIDTEGSELEILEAFPFDRWNVRAFTIEHNFGDQRARIRELMASHGYGVTEAKWDDWFWRDDEA